MVRRKERIRARPNEGTTIYNLHGTDQGERGAEESVDITNLGTIDIFTISANLPRQGTVITIGHLRERHRLSLEGNEEPRVYQRMVHANGRCKRWWAPGNSQDFLNKSSVLAFTYRGCLPKEPMPARLRALPIFHYVRCTSNPSDRSELYTYTLLSAPIESHVYLLRVDNVNS